MYLPFFGLTKNPFAMTADPNCLFLTAQHREAVAAMTYAISSQKGLLVMTGEVGTGKTTVLSRVLHVLKQVPGGSTQFAVVLHPTLKPDEFLEMVMLDFGISDIPASKALRLKRFKEFLLDCHATNRTAALIVDEAHKLSLEILEEIRLLGNLDLEDRKLLQIALVGQRELDDLMRREELRQLKQRVALRVALGALSAVEVKNYIRYRWDKAGGKSEIPFGPEAIEQLILWSRGIPRIINSLCDQCLLLAFAEESRFVEPRHVQQAARDLDLAPPAGPRPTAVPVTMINRPTPVRPTAQTQPEPHAAVQPAPLAVNGTNASSSQAIDGGGPAAHATGKASVGNGVVGDIRIPDFGDYGRRKGSFLSRWFARILTA